MPLSSAKRLAIFGHSPLARLPVADLRIRVTCGRLECAPFAVAITESVKGCRTDREGGLRALFKRTAAVTDLTRFPSSETYLKAVSRETGGKYHRSANKARRAGYFSRRIAPGSYAQSLFDIKASKHRRSHGVMPEAMGGLARPNRDEEFAYGTPPCREHWRIDWGLFNHADERMWGFASLIRAGNVVQLDHMMAHADVLKTGGMKLFQFDLMAWLLGRADPLVAGLDYLLHGAIEDGSKGAADWRRYVQQRPHALRLAQAESVRMPPDFDPELYLALNPDVRAAGAEPRKHYLRHGFVEGRAYK
jgi:hypothetical protein